MLPGAAPMVLDLAPLVAGLRPSTDATLVVASAASARVMIDGLLVGRGQRVEVPLTQGDHEIAVEADGHAPFTASRRFSATFAGSSPQRAPRFSELRGPLDTPPERSGKPWTKPASGITGERSKRIGDMCAEATRLARRRPTRARWCAAEGRDTLAA